MKLTKREVELITRAEKALKGAKVARMMLLIVLLISFASMLYGILPTDTYTYISLGVVFFAIFIPNFGGPSYDEIVELLVKVRTEIEPDKVDPLIDALTSK